MNLLTPTQRAILEAPLTVPMVVDATWGYFGVIVEMVVYLTLVVIAAPWLYFCWRAAREATKRTFITMFKEPW